jgi:hypothetical protein
MHIVAASPPLARAGPQPILLALRGGELSAQVHAVQSVAANTLAIVLFTALCDASRSWRRRRESDVAEQVACGFVAYMLVYLLSGFVPSALQAPSAHNRAIATATMLTPARAALANRSGLR